MKILVTGGTSPVGAALARQLLARGHDVRVLTRNPGLARRLDGLVPPVTRIWFCAGDIRDAAAVNRAVSGCDAVVHAAYAPVTAPDREVLDVAVHGMAVVLAVCERQAVRQLMLVSSPWADGTSVYGAGKLVAERMTADWAEQDTPCCAAIVRVFNPYGPDMGTDHVIPQLILRMARLDREHPDGITEFPLHGSGEDLRAFTWREDCAAQLCDLLESAPPGGLSRCDAGSADVRTIASVAHDIAACFGRVIAVRPDAGAAVSRQVPRAGLPPRVSFTDGLARTVAWYREHEKELAGD